RVGAGGGSGGHSREPTRRHIHVAGVEQSLLDLRERHQGPRLDHDREGQPPPPEMVEITRRARELAGPTGEGPQGEPGERQPDDVFQPRPGAPEPRTPRRGDRHVAAGSTRILTCSSGWASASNAPGTPSSSTVPVIIGDASISPSARARKAPANSSTPYARAKCNDSSLAMAKNGRI